MTVVKHVLIGLALSLLVLNIYINSPVETSYDSLWTTHLAFSLIRSGDFDFNEYPTVSVEDYHFFVNKNNKIVSFFPVGTVLLSVPFYKWIDYNQDVRGLDMYDYLKRHSPNITASNMEQSIASSLMAISVFVVFLMSMRWLGSVFFSLLASLIFAFATPVWSVASRALWSHTGSIFLLTLSGAFLLGAEKSKKHKPLLLSLATVMVVLSYMMRPTNLVIIAAFVFYYLIKLKVRFLLLFVTAGITFGVILLVHSFAYGTPFPPYFAGSRIGISSLSVQTIAGVLVSPQRGLFIYCSWILVPLAVSLYRLIVRKILLSEVMLLGVMLMQVIVVAAFPHWWGGHSFGPRLLTETVVVAVFLVLLQLGRFLQENNRRVNKAFVAYIVALFVLGSVSTLIHYKGANSQAVWVWNVTPMNVDSNPDRLWDWNDIQFMRS